MNEHLIEAATSYITSLFQGNADGHDAAHSLRVYRNALQIAADEPTCDLTVVTLAALLHDADDHKLFNTRNNANARAFLTEHEVAPERIERICTAINEVSFSQNRGVRPSTLEGMIVQDADRLDALGAIGIARTFAFGGKHARSLESSVAHFYEKLLLLKDLMNTTGGKAQAERRHAFLEAFLDELALEGMGEGATLASASPEEAAVQSSA